MSKVLVYCAVSLDGFIAGPDDDLSWLDASNPEPEGAGAVGFAAFMEQTGAILMGRRTFDTVMGFRSDWPYGSTPVLVATTRPLLGAPASVSACRGGIRQLCGRARQAAGDRNVYLDGGNIISQAMDAGCVDEMILTVAPVFLGQGVPLYQGKQLQRFSGEYLGGLGEMMQVRIVKPKTEAD